MRPARLVLLAALLTLALPVMAQRAAQQNALGARTPTTPATATTSTSRVPTPAPAKAFSRVLGRLDGVMVPVPRSLWESSVWEDPDRGFFWYPDQAAPAPSQLEPEHKKSIRDLATLEEVEKELRRLRSEAIMNPNEDNVREYLDAQVYVMDKSAMFSDVARRASWTDPSLAYTARTPVTNTALANQRERRAAEERALIAELGKSHGLFFFYRGDCHYCKDQAPILKVLKLNYGIPVMAISLDGSGIAGFPDARPDNGISMLVSDGKGIEAVPALYLVHKDTKSSIPIGFGVLAVDQILNRVRVLVTTQPGQEY